MDKELEDKFDQIFEYFARSEQRFDRMEERFDRIEEMTSSLIQIVGATNAKLEEMQEDLNETKNTLHIFRSETNLHFKKLDRRVTLIETNLDATMLSVEELHT